MLWHARGLEIAACPRQSSRNQGAGHCRTPPAQNSSRRPARLRCFCSQPVATTPPPASASLKDWGPAFPPMASGGSLYAGLTKILPLERVGLAITVRDRSGKS